MRQNEQKIAPLMQSQLGVYLACAENPESLAYNITYYMRLPGQTDFARMKEAVKTVVKAHPSVMIRLKAVDGVPCMIQSEFEVEVGEKSVASLEDEIRDFARPFDLENGPLFRFEIVHMPAEDGLLFDIHHTVFDGTSVKLFAEQLAAAYDTGVCPAETRSIFDAAEEQAKVAESEKYAAAEAFFQKKFDGVDFDLRPAPDVFSEDNDLLTSESIIWDARGICTRSRVLAFAAEHNISENAVLTGAFAYALGKFSGLKASCLCAGHNGRTELSRDIFGMFVKTMPLYFEIDENESVSAFLKRVFDDYYQTKVNCIVPLGQLAAKYGFHSGINFVNQASLFNRVPFSAGDITIRDRCVDQTDADMEFMISHSGDSYSTLVHFRRSVYTKGLIEHFCRLYYTAVNEMLCRETLGEIELTGKEEKEALCLLNRTEQPYRSDKTVVDLFREQAQKTPDALCTVYREKRFTYRQVDALTDILAKHLVQKGIGAEKVVGVLIPRNEYMVIASLGVLKAGGAYLPLDPTYPAERLNLMVKDSGACLLIEDKSLDTIITGDFEGERITTDEIGAFADIPVSLPTPAPGDLFVMLYTSGSTGVPKGVMFEHANTAVTTEWVKKYFSMDETSRVTAYAAYGFDAHAFDIYPTITSGAELHIIPDEIRLDFPALRDYFNANGITHTVMTMQVGRQFALMGGLKTLKHLSVAGEKLTPLEKPENLNFYNLYGPTEGSVITSAFLMDKKYRDVPIGCAVDNLKTYIVDDRGRLLPIGAVGELWIAGPHVTRGYLNRPEKQAEAFGTNPFESVPGYERIYRTGDVVRLCADGNLQFVGRRDAQVKVRGFRVELTEVEEVIRRFDGVKDATVAAFDAPSGGKYLAAYIVSDSAVSSDALAAFIKSEKPPYMVPSVVMQIDAIPLNQNGKVNKRALPLPEFKAQDVTPPENEMQQKIFDIVCDIVGHRNFGIDTDLFEVGLTSIGVIKLNVALGDALGISVKIKDVKDNETVRKLEAFSAKGTQTLHREVLADYPLTKTQRGILTECLAQEGSTAYNIPLLMKIGKGIDIPRLKAAVEAAINTHPLLKAVLSADDKGDVRAHRHDGAAPCVTVLQGKPETGRLNRPFNILGGALYRAEIYTGENENYLFIDCHHIISDGTSEKILLADIETAYFGGTPAAEVYSGFEAAVDEELAAGSEAFDRAKAHYDSLFAGCDSECLPPKAPEKDKAGAGHLILTCPTDYDRVAAFCRENEVTPNAFFNGAFGFTLSRFDYKEDVVYTTVYNGRNDSRLARSVAMLVKTLPVALNTEGKATVKNTLKALGTQLMNSMANDIYSFAEISRAYSVKADLIFVYQGDEFCFDSLCGEPAEMLTLESETAKAPISLSVYIRNGKIVADAEYEQSLYGEAFIRSFTESFFAAIGEFLTKETLGEVSLLTENAEAQYRILNNNDMAVRSVPCYTLVDEFAAKQPDKTAVIAAGKQLTYGQLTRLSNRVANALRKLGAAKGSIIGLLTERCTEVYVCELGIMKAGCAFLPMLPSYPDDRIDYCLTNAESPLIITTAEILNSRKDLFCFGKSYRAVTVESLLEQADDTAPDVAVSPDDTAYCIYTSGSTGTPKGVLVKHGNFSNFVQTQQSTIRYLHDPAADGAMISLSSISFDMSLYEIMLPLCAGKTACMATDEEIHNPAGLISLLQSANVQMITCTPTFMTNMIGIPEFAKCLGNLKSVTVGAEAFPPTLYDTLKKASPDLQIINGYGPTECTICCSVKELTSGEKVTIGRPTGNVKFFVTDKFGNVLPPFASGELIICGAGVGGGYIKLPEKNAASFFTLRGLPAYHSGDLVRLNDDAEIAFAGRIDNQVKLRGFRIELDEIEKTACAFEGVSQCKVLVRNNGSEDYLAGFFTADRPVSTEELTEHLKSRLTYYMVPAVLVQLDKMPLTPNGKIDKNGFPEVQRTVTKKKRRAAKKSLEQRLCEIFADVLNTDEVYADDNFFELGGTSISASKVTMLLMSENIEVKYGDIFDNPTPEGLAAFIEGSAAAAAPAPAAKGEELSINGQKTRKALACNTVKYAAEVERKPLGDVLLTGAVGFLGIHILKELLEIESGHIYCLVRKGRFESPEARLKTMLVYYFSNGFAEELKTRITLIDADITDSNLDETFRDIRFDTVINCAACVKHFAGDDILERINIHGIENLIELCTRRNTKLIQISTVSVPGIHTPETYEKQVRMHENELFVIDDMANKYCISKYKAELRMFDAIENGMRGKVIRVGNLMGRHTDGEFQINMETNMFMSGIRGFSVMGKYPISHMTDPMSFSPVDCTARAVVLLSGVNDIFTAFNCNSRYGFDEMKIIDACNRNGITILPEKDEIYYEEFRQKLGQDNINNLLNGLAAYDIKDSHAVETDNLFTTNILYRIGFSWPLIDDAYLDRSIASIMALDYFDVDTGED